MLIIKPLLIVYNKKVAGIIVFVCVLAIVDEQFACDEMLKNVIHLAQLRSCEEVYDDKC